MAKTTDYDAPRAPVEDQDRLEELQALRSAPGSPVTDGDDSDLAESLPLPATDPLDEELTVTVIPMRSDEFRCERCFLVHHHTRRATDGQDLCRDCT